MNDEKKEENKITEKESTGKKFVWKWKDALIYGLIWMCLAGTLHLGTKGCVSAYRKIQTISRIIDGAQRFCDFDQDWNRWGDGSAGKNQKRGRISNWIRNHLPKDAAPEETKAVSDTFRSVAEMLRDGSLEGWDDSCSEMIAQLQPNVSRQTWLPFMTGLANQIGDDDKADPDSLSDIYEQAAKAVAAPVRTENDGDDSDA